MDALAVATGQQGGDDTSELGRQLRFLRTQTATGG